MRCLWKQIPCAFEMRMPLLLPANGEKEMTFEIYAQGLVHSSVCAPADWTKEQVENAVNGRSPTGISSPWKVSEDTHFRTGEENGYHCTCNGKRTRHWLMSC